MKPQLLKISVQPEYSFNACHDVVPVFYNKWHYHKEVELVYIVKGTGSQFIGYDTKHFKTGDMILVGSGLPHMWQSDQKYLLKTRDKFEAYVIQFLPDFLGADFFILPENNPILSLLEKAQRGITIKYKTKEAILVLMKTLLHARSTNRIILLLRILRCIAISKDQQVICSKKMPCLFQPAEQKPAESYLPLDLKYRQNEFGARVATKEFSSSFKGLEKLFMIY